MDVKVLGSIQWRATGLEGVCCEKELWPLGLSGPGERKAGDDLIAPFSVLKRESNGFLQEQHKAEQREIQIRHEDRFVYWEGSLALEQSS